MFLFLNLNNTLDLTKAQIDALPKCSISSNPKK